MRTKGCRAACKWCRALLLICRQCDACVCECMGHSSGASLIIIPPIPPHAPPHIQRESSFLYQLPPYIILHIFYACDLKRGSDRISRLSWYITWTASCPSKCKKTEEFGARRGFKCHLRLPSPFSLFYLAVADFLSCGLYEMEQRCSQCTQCVMTWCTSAFGFNWVLFRSIM